MSATSLDVTIVKHAYSSVPTYIAKVDDRTTTSETYPIYAGEPTKIYGAEGGNYVVKLATGEPKIGTDIVTGISAKQSTETATANGEVELYMPLPGIIYECAATTSSNFAEGILFDTVTFDLTTSTFTVNENEGSDENVHGLRMLAYHGSTGKVEFIIKGEATILDCMV